MKKIKLNPVDFVYEITEHTFTFVNGNRPTNAEHVRSIKRAMKLGAFVPPILVDSATNEIVDGQHRYKAACELWNEGIQYTLLAVYHDYGNALEAAITYNNKSKGWRTADYIRAYIAEGKTSYVLLQRFCATHKMLNGTQMQYKTALQIITGSSNHLTDGLLRITEENLLNAEIIYHELELMAEITECTLIIRRDHVLAWMQVREMILAKMSLVEWISKIGKSFSMPMSEKRADWANEYLRIALL